MNAFLPFDVAALLVLWWTAAAFAHGGNEVQSWRSVLLCTSLIAVHAFSITGVFSLTMQPRPIEWVLRGILWGGAGIAAWLYDHRFGVGRHLRMTREAVARWISRHKPTSGVR